MSQTTAKPNPHKVLRSITLEVAGKKIELSIEDAKELRDALISLWPEQAGPTVIYRDRYPWWPSYWYSQTERIPDPQRPYCTWSSTSANVSMTPTFTCDEYLGGG
jgi:hypothetical protein